MGWKKTVAIGLVTLSVGALLFNQKLKTFLRQFDSLKIVPTGLSDLKFSWNNFSPTISFNVDLKFLNPLSEAVSINGIIGKLQRVIIYDTKGKALGVSTPNIGKIYIPANGSFTLPKVPFVLDAKQLAITLLNYKKLTTDSFYFESIISVLGAEYRIRQ